MSESASGGAWSVAFRQWRGERRYQEDDFGITGGVSGGEEPAPELLMVLADGMGGEAGGARASRYVVRTFLGRFGETEGPAATRLSECLDAASRGLHEQVRTCPELDGMGSTVVAVVYDGRGVSWLSVGDSPMWLFTGGRLTRLNADHSMAPVLDRMAELGELSREEALSDGTRHMLRSAVTGLEVELVDRARRSCRLGQGDYLLVASDGLETLAETDIERRLATANGHAEAAADALFSAVRSAGRPNQDNVTFLLLAGKGRATRPAELGRTAPASLPALPPVVRAGNWRTGATTRSAAAALSVVGGLVLALALTWWHLIDRPPPASTSDSLPEPGAGVHEPAADDSRAQPPAPGGKGVSASTTTTGEPAAGHAPATSPPAPVDATPEPPLAPVDTGPEPPPAPAERHAPASTNARDTAMIEPPEPVEHAERRAPEAPGSATRAAPVAPPAPAPSTAEPAPW